MIQLRSGGKAANNSRVHHRFGASEHEKRCTRRCCVTSVRPDSCISASHKAPRSKQCQRCCAMFEKLVMEGAQGGWAAVSDAQLS